jgi:hypothetical protein
MNIAIVCPGCGYEIPEHLSRCPRCGYEVATIRSPSGSADFTIWEGDYTVVDIQHSDRPSKLPPPSRGNQYPQKSIGPYKPSSPLNSEVCKCLGTIEGTPCNTYYFVSSVKRHRGCARRDCSNSFENNPKIIVDRGTEKVTDHKEDYSWLNVSFGVTGLIILLICIAEESILALLGIVLLIMAIIPYSYTRHEREKVTFQLVRRSEIPKSAKDPWTQRDILR